MGLRKFSKIHFLLLVISIGFVLTFQNCGGSKNFSAGASKNSSSGFVDLNNNGINDDDEITDPHENLACVFDGQEIESGVTVTGYLSSTVPYGSSCEESSNVEQRTCEEGNLTGSFNFSHCVVGAPAACLFNGRTIAHGETVEAFLNSAPAAGSVTCNSEIRTCVNGHLSGSYGFSQCSQTALASCDFNGRTVVHGESVKAFLSSSVAAGGSCSSEMRVCVNGNLNGSFKFSSCNVDAPASCMFNNQMVANGQVVTAYQNSSVPFGSNCVSEARTCKNGVLSGSFNMGSCKVDAAASCLFDGKTIAHNQTVKAYTTSTVPFGQGCTSVARTCNNGQLSGSGNFSSCTPQAAASCSVGSMTYAHAQQATFFKTSTVPFGQSCQAETRTCSNGTMSGTYSFTSCNVNAAASCLFNGQNLAHGQTITAYTASSVPYTSTCASVAQSRTCNNGVLSNSGDFASCQVMAAPESVVSASFSVPQAPVNSTVTLSVNTQNVKSVSYSCNSEAAKSLPAGATSVAMTLSQDLSCTVTAVGLNGVYKSVTALASVQCNAADQVYSGGKCVAFSCQQFVEVTSFPAQIPARTTAGICYYSKLYNSVANRASGGSKNTNIISRRHGSAVAGDVNGNGHPFMLGEAASRQFKLMGPRAVKVSGDKITLAPIKVDNYILVGKRLTTATSNSWKAYGTSDATVKGTNYVQAYGQNVALEAFASGGTATVNALLLTQDFEALKDYVLDVHALDCGGSAALSELYLMFQ